MEALATSQHRMASPVRVQRGQDVSDADRRVYESVVSPDLSDEQRERIVTPARVYDGQRAVLAVHWHPESGTDRGGRRPALGH